MFLILLDIHRNILSVQGFIRCISKCISEIQIILETSSLVVKFYDGCLPPRHLKIIMPDNFLQPCSVSSINCKNRNEHMQLLEDEVVKINFPLIFPDGGPSNRENIRRTEAAFRCLISNYTALENCNYENCNALNFRDFMQIKLEKFKTCYIFCTNCGSLLSESGIYYKTFHKYYEDVSDSAETWFCHKHDDHKDAENFTDSLYISDMHFYFHDSMLKDLLISDHNKGFNCNKCFSVLSFKKKMNKPHYIGFFADKIMLQKSKIGNKVELQKYRKDIALFAFCSIIEDLSKLVNFSDIYLQCKVDEKIEVLLLRFSSEKVAQFMLHEENDEEIPHAVEFKTKEVYKVLHCICSPDSVISQKWKHDFRVDFFLISDNMMTVIKDLLLDSSKYIRNNLETVDGFSFGYLPANVPMLYHNC